MIEKVEALFERQVRGWPMLAKGVEGLARAETRPMRIDWYDVFVRHIPHRVTSTTAAVDRESISHRPCFLCAANLPAEEEGVNFGDDFTIYCNPFPIIEHHLTITHREHREQRIAGNVGSMLDLAKALPGYFAIYNGPECGASAPDHLHFQAGTRNLLPIETDSARVGGLTLPDYGRNVIVFRSDDRATLIDRMERAIDLLATVTGKRAEPMINIAVFHERSEWITYLFPRAKHRPKAFETGDLTVSPAAIDLCGIFVVPLARDFAKITGSDIAAIFGEITLPENQFREIAAKLESYR
jgi:hypothetical protein